MKLKILSSFLLLTFISGCANYKDYAQAIKEQNYTIQLENKKQEKLREERERKLELERQAHRERMAKLMEHMIISVAKTETQIDDVLAPVLFTMMEDKWQIAEMLANSKKQLPNPVKLQKIEAPEKTSDIIRASTGIVLGLGGIAVQWNSTNKMADIAEAGMKSAGVQVQVNGDGNDVTYDSYKTGSQNSITGDNNQITGGNIDDDSRQKDQGVNNNGTEETESTMPDSCEGQGFFENDTWWYSTGCSCESHSQGHC